MSKTLDSMNKIRELYRFYAPKYIALQKENEAAEKKINDVRNSFEITSQGKEKRIAVQREIIRRNREEMNGIAEKTKVEAKSIRCELERQFYASPDDLNMAALELLKSGTLSNDEILTIAKNSTSTTRRVMGSILSKSDDQKVRAIGIGLQERPGAKNLSLIDGLINVGNACIGDAPLSGAEGAENMFSRFDELTQPLFDGADGL